MCVCIYIYMNLYAYHCEPREARGNFYHWGWSLIVWSYTIFWIFPLIFYVKRTKTTCPFCILFSCCCFPSLSIFFFFLHTGGIRRSERIWQKREKSVEIPVISVISVGISALWADHSVLCEIWGGSGDRVPRRSAQHQPSQHAQTPPLLQVPRMLWGDPYGCPA